MTHDTCNTLGEVTISGADRNVITRLLQPQRQRQRRTDGTGNKNAHETIACRNKPTAEKVSRGNIDRLTPGVWTNNEIIHYAGRVFIAPNQQMSQTKGLPKLFCAETPQ